MIKEELKTSVILFLISLFLSHTLFSKHFLPDTFYREYLRVGSECVIVTNDCYVNGDERIRLMAEGKLRPTLFRSIVIALIFLSYWFTRDTV